MFSFADACVVVVLQAVRVPRTGRPCPSLWNRYTFYNENTTWTPTASNKPSMPWGGRDLELKFCLVIYKYILIFSASQGTRLENANKNVSQPLYAFNALQVLALPKTYRPTYKKLQTWSVYAVIKCCNLYFYHFKFIFCNNISTSSFLHSSWWMFPL